MAKAELKVEQHKILKLQAFDWSYFWGESHFEEDDAQNYLVVQPMSRYCKKNIGVGSGYLFYF